MLSGDSFSPLEIFVINVMIVEDSLVIQEHLKYVLESDPDIQVVCAAGDGREAVEMASRTKIDAVIMDINMPKMNGFEATRRIMETRPMPIIVVSASYDPGELATTFQALEAGALKVLEKPLGIGSPGYEGSAMELIQTVKLLSGVKLATRRHRPAGPAALPAVVPKVKHAEVKLVAIGVSTGGPVVLQTILAGFKKDFPVPVLIVQHMTAGFLKGLAEWLEQAAGFPVHVAAHDERICAGHAYLAPYGFHMGVKSSGRVVLSDNEPLSRVCPSISRLFLSVSDVFGPNAAGVLLTGMGRDGAEGLHVLKEKGAVTIAQDAETSLIFGMPGHAVDMGAAQYVLPPGRIVQFLLSLVNKKSLTEVGT